MKFEKLNNLQLEPQNKKLVANNTFQFEPTYQATRNTPYEN